MRTCAPQSKCIAVFRAAAESFSAAVPRHASDSLLRGSGPRNPVKVRGISIPVVLLAVAAALGVSADRAQAQTQTVYVDPIFYYGNYGWPPFLGATTAEEALADLQTESGGCHGDDCVTFSNLVQAGSPSPLAIVQNGNPYWYHFDRTDCDTSGQNCSTASQWGAINSTYSCPSGFG